MWRSLAGVSDRDEESDGEWEAPMIDNPEYKVSLFFYPYIYNMCVYMYMYIHMLN
jgi:hypothetical protein